MAHIESFSTAGLDPRRKLAFWNDRASESFSPLVSEPEDIREFNGSIMRGSIGDMSLAEVYSDAQIVRHSRSHVARTQNSSVFSASAVGGRKHQPAGRARRDSARR
jgi:hypothetical protein